MPKAKRRWIETPVPKTTEELLAMLEKARGLAKMLADNIESMEQDINKHSDFKFEPYRENPRWFIKHWDKAFFQTSELYGLFE
jgi:hypothetical protein